MLHRVYKWLDFDQFVTLPFSTLYKLRMILWTLQAGNLP